jgi:predicted  nucleic acid-binding Zn-ribbon protein
MDDQHKDWNQKAWLAGLLLAAAVGVLIFNFLNGCSVEPKRKAGNPPPTDTGTDTDVACEGDHVPGDVWNAECPAGQEGKKVLVCKADGTTEVASDTCKPAADQCEGKTTFAAVQPIMARSCMGSCHTSFDRYDVVKEKADEFMRRIDLPLAVAGHMPKGGELPSTEKELFRTWIADGKCENPDDGGNGTPPPPFKTFEDTERQVLERASGIDPEEREEIVWVVTTHRLNKDPAQEAELLAAINKALNSVSTEPEIATVRQVAPGIYEINMEDFGLDNAEWKLIEDADLLDLESFTSRGELLKTLTKKRKPWMPVEALLDAALRNATVYYTLLEIPLTFDELAKKLDVDYAEDLEAEKADAALAAFVGSPLSPHNRMVSRHKSRDGTFVVTYDTGPLNTREKNFFEFPCLAEVGCDRNAQFVAGEVIYELPNGMHAYALYAADQIFQAVDGQQKFVKSVLNQRQDAAPLDVVQDFRAAQLGLSAVIAPGASCFGCHTQGYLAFTDQMRQHVLDNGSEFEADRDLILAVYKGNQKWQDFLTKDNNDYGKVMESVGVTSGIDPISTKVGDFYLTSWNLDKLAYHLWYTPGDFRVACNGSATCKAQIGQVLSGGTITFDQLKLVINDLKVELRLFQDPLSFDGEAQ